MELNQRNAEAQRRRLEVGDQFRTLIPQSTARGMGSRRSFKTKFGEEVSTVLRVLDGGRVEDTENKIHKIKLLCICCELRIASYQNQFLMYVILRTASCELPKLTSRNYSASCEHASIFNDF